VIGLQLSIPLAYRKAARDGLCVAELRPTDPKAMEEARALFAEVFGQ
jgi:chromosome partitioning protein